MGMYSNFKITFIFHCTICSPVTGDGKSRANEREDEQEGEEDAEYRHFKSE